MDTVLKTDLVGLVHNLPHFKHEAMLPVFEAVVNSIQAIHEAQISDGKITVEIIRDGQLSLMQESKERSPIIGFTIYDNGIGFDDINYESFRTNHSTHKLDLGCKGVGRFVWLKAFDRVDINTVFLENGEFSTRNIAFSLQDGIQSTKEEKKGDERKTIVKLQGFSKDYRDEPSAYKKGQTIAQKIFEHCLSYYVVNDCPKIEVNDGDEIFDLDDIYAEVAKEQVIEHINISKYAFKIVHLKLYSSQKNMHNIVLCGNSRAVKGIKLSSYLGVNAEFDESGEKFIYSVYVMSDYLDKNVDSMRLEFLFPDKEESQYSLNPGKYPIVTEHIIAAVLPKSKTFLNDYLENLIKQKQDIIDNYVSSINPTLRAVPTYCPEIFNEIYPNTSPERIDEILYKYKGKAEFEIKKQSEKLLKTQASSVAEIEEEYESITKKLTDFQKDQLASYILFRKKIIELLDKKIALSPQGKYYDEAIVHDIIFPQHASTNKIRYEDHNLWLIDERLTFHDYAKSEQTYSSDPQDESTARSDIIIYSEVLDDKTARTVTIVELKKPQRKNFDSNPIEQINNYIRKAKNLELKTDLGRTLHVDNRTKFFCYAICDINDRIKVFAEDNVFTPMAGERGYYKYNPNYNAHIEIIDFDKIVSDAMLRHKSFFLKLGI